METYSPSIDWGNELVPSLLWILKAWTISAVVVLIICVLLMRYTVWGRQFWRVSGDYFKGPESVPVWGLFAVLLLSVIVSVRIAGPAQLLPQRPVLGAADRVPGSRCGQRTGPGLRYSRILVRHRDFRDPRDHLRRTVHARHLPDAAVHHPVAGMAHRPADRRLAGPPGLLPRALHRPHHRQSRPAHPAGHRHLHHRLRPDPQHAVLRHGERAAVRRCRIPWCR